MAVFAISDLHLSLGIDKPMDIFGYRWTNHMDKLEKYWGETVGSDDYIIIPGDISWATYLEQGINDFEFIDALPGIKIISKGNHDYWWTTMSKLNKFIEDKNFSSIRFMHNNNYRVENFIICGTRGWNSPGDDGFGGEDQKIYNRELNRLELSLNNINKKDDELLITALHYPPFNSCGHPTEFVDVMKKHNVDICIYGHIHGEGFKTAVQGEIEGIDFRMVSADYLNFKPLRL